MTSHFLRLCHIFPYPTLFRPAREEERVRHVCRRGAEDAAGGLCLHQRGDERELRLRDPECVGRAVWPDRKSTRLNSSHLVSSYAVFCLQNRNTKATSTVVKFF